MNKFKIKIKPLTPIWTGDAQRESPTLRETGIIGSLRWWYEALIRGLGGSACDPTDTQCNGQNHCAACELFGCTGWARKFRLEIEEVNNQNLGKNYLFKFIELRKIEDVEWALLKKVLMVISKYGALGGKIAEFQFGVIQIEIEKTDLNIVTLNKEDINKYLKKNMNTADNPTLSRFVFINENLKNRTVADIKNKLLFLKGQKGKGKRYFYKTDNNNNPLRFFAYAENEAQYKKIVEHLKNSKQKFIKGSELVEDLL
jgi:CRISPR-associated protein Cmr1